jgi:autotransporter strand-loop-strand O-heptosyltransferase
MFNYKLFLIEGLYFELLDSPEDKEYNVRVLDGEEVIYQSNLKRNMWLKTSRRYLSNYFVEIWDGDNLMRKISFLEHIKGNRVFISFESKSLGDSIAWIPYCLKFKETYGCDVIVSTFLNDLFEKVYPELEFVGRGVVVNNIVSMIQIGWFWDDNMEPVHPATIPLQRSASNILHLPFEEIQPRIHYVPKERPTDQGYVVISVRSTSQLKHWDYWQELVDSLNEQGYAVYEVSKEPCDLNNIIQVEDKSFENVMNIIHHAELFIGLSSGLSWLAWGMGKKSVMISNFTQDDHEFTSNCIRITNKNVCHGCWNNPMFKFDKGNWWWCPEHEDTDRQFECHKSISAEYVMNEIKKAGF